MAQIEQMMEEIKGMTVLELNQLVKSLEEEFGVSVADEELVPENFGSIANLKAYLERKLAA